MISEYLIFMNIDAADYSEAELEEWIRRLQKTIPIKINRVDIVRIPKYDIKKLQKEVPVETSI